MTSNFEEDKTRERKFALEHFGLDKTSFMNTALVRQSQIDNRFAKDKSEAEKSLELLIEGKIFQYWNDKRAQLAERIKSLDEKMPSFVNLVEEEIELCKEELKGLKRHQKALNTAKDIIEEVTKEFHSQVFAPELNRVMSELIQKVITKYDEVKIEQDLSINVRIPEIDSIKKIEDFGSKGVIDQFYFVLRVAIAKLLTKDGETLPLILDDPFESFDDNKLREALDFLIDLSTKNQVILLTCHQQAQVNELKKQLQAKDVAFQENDVGELKSICT